MRFFHVPAEADHRQTTTGASTSGAALRPSARSIQFTVDEKTDYPESRCRDAAAFPRRIALPSALRARFAGAA